MATSRILDAAESCRNLAVSSDLSTGRSGIEPAREQRRSMEESLRASRPCLAAFSLAAPIAALVLLFAAAVPIGAQTFVPNWVQRSPAASPPARDYAAMAYDATHGQVVLFGGIGSSFSALSDTWVWEGTNWTQKTPATSPPPRVGATMVYDAPHGQVVLFGGTGSSGELNDTWVWDGTNWTQKTPANSPPVRYLSTMAYDAAQDQVVLFGGLGGSGYLGDTWVWDGTNWTQKTPATSPSARYISSMAYDAAHGLVVLFGGDSNISGVLNDTWEWNGTNWTQENPAAAPSARDSSALAYDPSRSHVVLFGGENNKGDVLDETWVWNGATWTQELPATSPSARVLTTMAYDASTGNVVLFGGQDNSLSVLGDTWELGQGDDFGSVSIGTTSAAQTLNFSIPGGTTVGGIGVLTLGAPNLDFTRAGGDTCTATTYASATNCTVNVQFAPKFAGMRMGAVVFKDSSGNVLSTAYISGIGTGPQIAFEPATITTLGGGFGGPINVAVDGSGDVYVADSGNSSGVKEIPAGCVFSGCVKALGGNSFTGPYSVAVDGAGNVYVADFPVSRVLEMPPGCTSSSCVTTLGGGFATPYGVAVDGSGNVYVPDWGHNIVKEMPPGCTSAAYASSACTITTLGGGFSELAGVAVDGSGNVYVADQGNSAVKEMPPGCTSSSCVITIGGGFQSPNAIAVDGSGDVYVADFGNKAVTEMPAGCASSTCVTTLGSGFNNPFGVALDGAGNIYVGDESHSAVKEFNAAAPPSLTFANTNVGSQSSDSPQTATLRNIGNAPLSFPVPGTGENPSTSTNFTLDSSTTCPEVLTSSSAGMLAPGATCALAVDFIPTTTGTISGAVILTDNNLNASAAMQSIGLNGTGIAATPTANSQTTSTTEGAPVTVTLTGSDPLGESLTFVIDSAPAHGSLSALAPIGATSASVTYTPNALFYGSDSFTFHVVNTSGQSSAEATVSISVSEASSAPVANAQTGSVGATSPPTTRSVAITLTGSDANGDAMTFSIVTPPAHGSLSSITAINSTSASVIYSGSANFAGSDSFVFQVSNPFGLAAQATVSITVLAPVPLINDPAVPTTIIPGTAGLTLAINGTGFVSGSTVNWNGQPRTTTFVSGSQLTASITTVDLATATTGSITVVNPVPGGGASNAVSLSVTNRAAPLTLNETNYASISDANSIALADFNGDGILDMAVTGDAPGSGVVILLGKSDGTLSSPTFIPTGSYPTSVTAVDLNGDGKPDLVVTNSASGNVSVLLGNGDGTFQAPVNYAVGTNPAQAVVADFNGDGKLDLAVAGSGSVLIMLGNGDGTFQSPVSYPASGAPYQLAVGDLNGDGALDLVVANNESGPISVLMGNGDGTFQPAVTYGAGAVPNGVAVADVNGDGKLDVITANFGGGVSVLLGNGDGTFQTHVDYPTGSGTTGVTVEDLDGDGKLDLAASNALSSTVSVLLGNGDGTFQTHVDYPTDSRPQAVIAADWSKDGRLDLITPNLGSGDVSILEQIPVASLSSGSSSFGNQGFGTTSASQSITLSNTGSAPMQISSIGVTGTSAGDFAQTNTCGAALPAGANCTFNVTFTPSTLTTESASLAIANNAAGSPQTVTLTGTGVPALPMVSFTGAPTSAGLGSSFTVSATTNSGSTAIITASGACSIIGNTVTMTSGTGVCSLTANWAASTDYLAASATQTTNATQIAPTVIFTEAPPTAANGSQFTVSATTNSSSAVVITASGVCSIAGATVTMTGSTGACILTATWAADSNYLAASATQSTYAATGACTVIDNSDNPSDTGSLRYCVNNAVFGRTINFAASLNGQTITLSSANGPLAIGTNLNIQGPGANLLTISGGNSVQAFSDPYAAVTISGLTIANGFASGGANGGAISTYQGTVTVMSSTLSGNSGAFGGGIYSAYGTVTVTNSTFAGNSVYAGGNGGAITVYQGSLLVNNSTFFGNSAAYGGGIYNVYGPAVVSNSTLSGNSASNDGGAIDNYQGTVTLFNSIVAGNTEQPGNDCRNCGSQSPYNLINTPSNSPAINPLLVSLGNFGGPTQTMLPLPGSPAICAASSALIPAGVTTDQRGFPNSTTYNSTQCFDLGAVQTNYALSFKTEPPSTGTISTLAMSPAPAVTVAESGNALTGGSVSVSVTDANSDLTTSPVTATTSISYGQAAFSNLIFNGATSNDTLTASLALNPNNGLNLTTSSTSFSVAAASPTVTWPTASAINYGQTLASSTLSGGSASFDNISVAGSFAFVNPSAAPSAGTQTESVTFTPSNTSAYNSVIGAVGVLVNKAMPTVTFGGAPANAPYEGTFAVMATTNASTTATITASGSCSIAGATVTITSPSGICSLTATWTADSNYLAASASQATTATQATPAVTWPSSAAITYGTALSGTQLDATATSNGANVAGTFVYTPAKGTVLTAGTQTLSVTFTPSKTVDFTGASASVTLQVSQATPKITWAKPAAITYRTALSSTQLDATASVPGTFTYSPVAGSILAAGSKTLSVTFTPIDAVDYTTATDSVTITVNQAAPTVTWATPAAITYGTALSGTQLDATASVPGTFVYSPAMGATEKGGSDTLSVTFTPTDSVDYTTAKASVTLQVNQATPIITWTTPAAITYGMVLSGTQLDATATYNGAAIAGTFAYTPAKGTVLTAGTETLSVTFTPTNTTNYAVPPSASATLRVNRATPKITWTKPGAITYGTALSATQLDATASVAGILAYSPAAGTVLNGGAQTLSVSFTPNDTIDYTTATDSVTVTVNTTTSTTTITSNSPNPATVSEVVTANFSVTGASGVPTGSVTVTASSGESCSGSLGVVGTGSCALIFTATGSPKLTAVYGGDNNFKSSTSAKVTETVN